MRASAMSALVGSVILLVGCGNDSSRSINVGAINCDLQDALEGGVLHLSSERGHGPADVDCVLSELADVETALYLQESAVPAIGDREINDGVWMAWMFGEDSSFIVKFAGDRDAAIS